MFDLFCYLLLCVVFGSIQSGMNARILALEERIAWLQIELKYKKNDNAKDW